MTQDEKKSILARIISGIHVTKVVATRSVKGKYGDTFVGFSAAWNSVQEDGGQDLVKAGDDTDDGQTVTGMTLKEAMIASCILSREVDIAAYRNAAAGGNITAEQARNAIANTKAHYGQVLLSLMDGRNDENPHGGK